MSDTSKKLIDKWILYPDSIATTSTLTNRRFTGYLTRDDVTEIKGGFPIGQNIIFTDGGKPTVRPGSERIGSLLDLQSPITRAWRFERGDGTEIELRSYGTKVEYYINGVSSDYGLLKDGFTSGQKFTFNVISKSSNTVSTVYFCNGVEDWYKFTGVYGLLDSYNDGAHTLTIAGSSTLSALGFSATGTIIINGTEIIYTGLSTNTFTGCSAIPALTSGMIIMQSPTVVAALTTLKSSVGIVHDSRIHARLESKRSVSNYSKLDDPEDWTTGSLDGAGGSKEIEGGGPITAYGRDEGKLLIFKKRQIKTLEFKTSGTRVDVPVYGTFKPSDDKCTTIGSIGDKSTFHAPNGIIFVTEDKEMLMLRRQELIDYPQQVSLTDLIKPTFQLGVHDEASGIVYKSKIYYSYKQDSNSTANDVVIIYDLIRERWFLPIIGWSVADWTIVDNTLHWHSATSPNSYKLIDDKTDDGLPFTTILRTHSEDFGETNHQKNVSELLLEIYMTDNTEIELAIMYDEDGYTEIVNTTLKGTDTNNIINSKPYNPYGASAFGTEQFGSNADINGMKKYRYIIPLKANNEFYNIALQLTTVGAGMNYELIRYGYHLDEIFYKNNKQFIFNI